MRAIRDSRSSKSWPILWDGIICNLTVEWVSFYLLMIENVYSTQHGRKRLRRKRKELGNWALTFFLQRTKTFIWFLLWDHDILFVRYCSILAKNTMPPCEWAGLEKNWVAQEKHNAWRIHEYKRLGSSATST